MYLPLLLSIILGDQHLCGFEFKDHPRSEMEVNQSTTFNLTCVSYNSSPLSPHEFKWSKDEVDLPLGNSYQIQGKEKPMSVLTVRNTSSSDSGTYKCVCIENDANGNHSNDKAEITVRVRGKSVVQHYQNLSTLCVVSTNILVN